MWEITLFPPSQPVSLGRRHASDAISELEPGTALGFRCSAALLKIVV